MAAKYDNWKEGDCGVDAREEARAEYIEDHYEGLVKQRLGLDKYVDQAIDDAVSDGAHAVSTDVARFFLEVRHAKDGDTDARTAAAVRLYKELLGEISDRLIEEAKTDVGAEFDRNEHAPDDMAVAA